MRKRQQHEVHYSIPIWMLESVLIKILMNWQDTCSIQRLAGIWN